MLPMIPEAVFSETLGLDPGTDQIRWPPMGLTSLGWGGHRIEGGGSAQGDQCPGVVAG